MSSETLAKICCARLKEESAKAKERGQKLDWPEIERIIDQEDLKREAQRSAGRRKPMTKAQQSALFDALAWATGSNPKELTRPAARAVAVSLADLLEVSPGTTDQEIYRRAEQYRKKYKDAACTAPALAKHWAEFGQSEAPTRPAKADPYIEPANWRAAWKKLYPSAAVPEDWKSWADVPITYRHELLKAV